MENLVMLIDKLLPLIGVVVGILVTKLSDLVLDSRRNFAKVIEIRRDEDLERIESIVFEVMEDACQYWSDSSKSEENRRLGISIRSRVSFLTALINELFEHHQNELLIATKALAEFHESSTGNLFLGENREPILNRIEEIELNSYQLVHCARTLRRNLPHERVKKWRI